MSALGVEFDQVDELVDRIAHRVIELLDQRDEARKITNAAPLVDAAAIAHILGISRSTVYEHRVELGGRQLGGGDRPRLRFDVEYARQAWTRRCAPERPAIDADQEVEPPRPRPAARPRRAAQGTENGGRIRLKRGDNGSVHDPVSPDSTRFSVTRAG